MKLKIKNNLFLLITVPIGVIYMITVGWIKIAFDPNKDFMSGKLIDKYLKHDN